MHSGIATMAREIVIGTVQHYNWVQLGAAIKHPDAGKKVKVQSDKNYKVPDGASITLYPIDGYGSPDLLRQILEMEKPDGIMIYTDPRFWLWLYQMEREIRSQIPIFYYNIWDDLPDPQWNAPFYASCDLLMGISKQTYGINKRVIKKFGEDWYKGLEYAASKHNL